MGTQKKERREEEIEKKKRKKSRYPCLYILVFLGPLMGGEMERRNGKPETRDGRTH